MIKIGIIGEGYSDDFFEDIAMMIDIEIRCIYSSSLSRAKEIIKEKQLIAKPTNLFETVVDEVDAVYICSVPKLHYDHAKYFLQQQTHVLIEKPLSLSFDQACELYEIAKKNNVVLLEAQYLLHTPIISSLFECTQKTQPIFANFNVSKLTPHLEQIKNGNFLGVFDEQIGKGITYDLLTYPVSLAVSLFGKVREVKAMSLNLSNNLAISNIVILKHENDVLVNIFCSATLQTSLKSEILSEDMTVIIDDITKIDEIKIFDNFKNNCIQSFESKTLNKFNSMIYLMRVFVKMIKSNENQLNDYLLGVSCEIIRVLELIEKNQNYIGED